MGTALLISDRRFILVLVAIALARLFGMSVMPLMDTSEPRYAEVARIMAVTGDWITPWFEPGVPFWGKPPLSFWVQALSIKAFGVSELSVRLPSFIAIAMLLTLVYRVAVICYGRRTAQLATLILSTMVLPLVSAGAVLTDPFLALGITLSMLAFYVAPLRPTLFWRYGFFIGISIGLLSKGPLAPVLIGVAILPWLMFQVDWRSRLSVFPWLSGSILALALSLPWYIAAEIKTPGFLHYFIVGEHFLRFVDSGWNGDLYGTAHERPLGSIWIEFLVASMPWGLAGLILSLYYLISQRKEKLSFFFRQSGMTYLVAWAVAAPVFFTLSGNILWTYVLPSLPAVSLLFARAAEPLLNMSLSRYSKFAVVLCLGLVPAASIALGVVSLAEPNRLKTEKALVAAAAEKMKTGSNLYFVESRPFSARFYSRGKAELVPRDQLESIVQTERSGLVAVSNKNDLDFLRKLSVKLNPLFSSRRYKLYEFQWNGEGNF